MPRDVDASLQHIERWLAANAPNTHLQLDPPADTAELTRAEAAFGRPLLPDVRRLYRWHDGSGGPVGAFWIAPEFGLLSLDDAIRQWRIWQQFGQDRDDPDAAYRCWFPIGTAYTGDFLVVDHAADTPEMVFEVLRGDGARRDKSWPSLATLLAEMVEAVESGQPLGYWDPHVSEGVLHWQE